MYSKIRDQSNGLFLFFVSGFLCGVGGALVCAPKRGAEVRAIFHRFSARLMDGVLDAREHGPDPKQESPWQHSPRSTGNIQDKSESDDRKGSARSSGRQEQQQSYSEKTQQSLDTIMGSRKPMPAISESTTGIPDPKANPRGYVEAMKKYDTPDGNR